MKEATQEINSLMKEDIKSLINQIKTTLKMPTIIQIILMLL